MNWKAFSTPSQPRMFLSQLDLVHVPPGIRYRRIGTPPRMRYTIRVDELPKFPPRPPKFPPD